MPADIHRWNVHRLVVQFVIVNEKGRARGPEARTADGRVD